MQLIHGDCFTVLRDLMYSGLQVDAIIADVPYVIKYDFWDKAFDINKAFSYCKTLLKENGNILIFQGWSNVCDTKVVMDKYWTFQNWIILDRIKGRGAKHQLVSTREDLLWYSNGKKTTFNKIYSNIPKKTKGMGEKNGQANRALTNIWYDISPIVPWSKERNGHPTQKSIQLMERIVSIFTNEGDIILDFTMGSGSTGVAAKNLGRDFIGIEINKDYFEIAKQRLGCL